MAKTASRVIRKHRKQVIILGILYVLGLVFFMNTSPDELPLLLLVLPFIYIFLVLYLSISLVCQMLAVKSAFLISLVIAVFGVLLFVLGSLHQLTVRDMIISLALTCLLTWYITRITDKRVG